MEYLADKNNVCSDLLWRSPNPPADKDFKPLVIVVQTDEVEVINSNEFEPQAFAMYSLEENTVINQVKPQIQRENINLEQDADKNI